MAPDIYGNIVILGVTGAGKTTLARAVAARTGRTLIDLDDHYWRPDWQSAPEVEFASSVAAALDAAGPQGWVLAGNYTRLQGLIWPRAQTIVALDYHPLRIFCQLLGRTLSRSWTGDMICNGNTETFAKSFFSRHSILVWFFKTFAKRRHVLRALSEKPDPAHAHLRILPMKHPKETAAWLNTL